MSNVLTKELTRFETKDTKEHFPFKSVCYFIFKSLPDFSRLFADLL